MEVNQKLLIAITPQEPVADEGRKIETLLRGGFDFVHLRHPQATRVEMRDIIESIPQQYHNRLVLHGHFDLTNDFNLGGLHLNHRCPTPPLLYSGRLSKSCHSVNEVIEAEGYRYVTLSPIFDSISKSEYHSSFTVEQLRQLKKTRTPVIALGGITMENILTLSGYNFSGYAMLGSIPWNQNIAVIQEFTNKKPTTIC